MWRRRRPGVRASTSACRRRQSSRTHSGRWPWRRRRRRTRGPGRPSRCAAGRYRSSGARRPWPRGLRPALRSSSTSRPSPLPSPSSTVGDSLGSLGVVAAGGDGLLRVVVTAVAHEEPGAQPGRQDHGERRRDDDAGLPLEEPATGSRSAGGGAPGTAAAGSRNRSGAAARTARASAVRTAPGSADRRARAVARTDRGPAARTGREPGRAAADSRSRAAPGAAADSRTPGRPAGASAAGRPGARAAGRAAASAAARPGPAGRGRLILGRLRSSVRRLLRSPRSLPAAVAGWAAGSYQHVPLRAARCAIRSPRIPKRVNLGKERIRHGFRSVTTVGRGFFVPPAGWRAPIRANPCSQGEPRCDALVTPWRR